MATDGTTPMPCAQDIYEDGLVVGAYVTAGACAFEHMIDIVRQRSGRRCDWHYVAGRAVVKCMPDDYEVVLAEVKRILGHG